MQLVRAVKFNIPSKIVSTSVKFAPFSATKIRAWPFFVILILIILVYLEKSFP
jgi:hypothetical protein